jgi:aryl-alcohol dehydrogenase-like predicted oxidoreductase
VAFGCAAIGGADYGPADDAESVRAVHAALDRGINFFDVADVYGFGRAERVLGSALRLAPGHGAVIATKGGVRWNDRGQTRRDSSPDWISAAVDGSLTRLGVERIDLYLIHWPDDQTPIEETLGALERKREEGKIDRIGCSNFPLSLVDRAQLSSRIDSTQLGLSLAERQHLATLQTCVAQYGMLTMTYSSLAHGLFSGTLDPRAAFPPTDLRSRNRLFQSPALEENVERLERVRQVAARHDRTCAATALRWVLEQSGIHVAIAGIRTPAQAIENASATDWRLSEEDLSLLEL